LLTYKTKIGLDQYLQRRFLPPKPTNTNEAILIELEEQEKEEAEEVFQWRKDYRLHDFVADNIGKFENCEELPLTKEHLAMLLEYFEKNHSTPYSDSEDKLDYSKEISQLKDILENDYFNDVEYFYYAWW